MRKSVHLVGPYHVKVFGNCFTQNVLSPYVKLFKSFNTVIEMLDIQRTIFFYCCTVHSDVCAVHSQRNALLLT
jgi:uncharacterized protein YggT (Ycf19 family)